MKKVKREIRTVGIDDAPFEFSQNTTGLVGCVFRGSYRLIDVLSTQINVDGMDVTEKIAKMLINSKHQEQVRVILLDGITFGGMNIVDMDRLCEETEKPVLALTKDKPSKKKMFKALENTSEQKKRKRLVEKAGEINELNFNDKNIFYQSRGLNKEQVKDILKATTYSGTTPEPLRTAHLIAKNI